MVAQSAVNRCVTGSSPVTGAIYKPSLKGGWFLKNPVVNWQGFVFLKQVAFLKMIGYSLSDSKNTFFNNKIDYDKPS